MERQMTFADIDGDYKAFVDKFKPKKTTDDCYTPPNIYDAVKEWAVKEYGLEGREIVRPFWPGAEFDAVEYPHGCVVLDNPPFSILSRIIRFYMLNRIDFFLFAPGLVLTGARDKCNLVMTAATITYENGAQVNTAFVTNMGEWALRSAPDLDAEIARLDALNRKEKTRKIRRLAFPNEVLTAGRLKYLAAHGVEFRLRRGEIHYMHDLDNCHTFGGCCLLSEGAATRLAAAERASAERVSLSEREKAIVRALSREARNED